jgi:drug/metabolite transporter (DMT)-like permease
MYIFGILANSISAACFAGANIVVRSLKHIDTQVMSTLFNTMSFFIGLICLVVYRFFINPNQFNYNFTFYQIFLLVLNGFLVSTGGYLYFKAFHLDKAGRASSLWFLAIVVGYAFDMVLLGYKM